MVFIQQTGVVSAQLDSICSTVIVMGVLCVTYPSPKGITTDDKPAKYVYDKKVSFGICCNLSGQLTTYPGTGRQSGRQRLFVIYAVVVAL